MSRYRNIYCQIWNDDKFPFLSDACQLVAFHLLTTPYSTPFGLYKAPLEALAIEKRWIIEKYRVAFNELSNSGFCLYDEKYHVIYLPKFLKYNLPANPNVLKHWAGVFSEIPPSPFKKAFLNKLTEVVGSMSKGYQEAFKEGFLISDAQVFNKQYQEKEKNQKKKEDQEQRNQNLTSRPLKNEFSKLVLDISKKKSF